MGHTTKRLVLLGFPDSKPLPQMGFAPKKTPLGDTSSGDVGALEVALIISSRKKNMHHSEGVFFLFLI